MAEHCLNYQQVYSQLIARARGRLLLGYHECHHIRPRCLGGDDSLENLVFLTYREHFIAHWLLIRIHEGHPRQKMRWALKAMVSFLPGRYVLPWQEKIATRAFRVANLFQIVNKAVGDDYYLMNDTFYAKGRHQIIKRIRRRHETFLAGLVGWQRAEKEVALANAMLALDRFRLRQLVDFIPNDNSPFTAAEDLEFPPWRRGRIRFFYKDRGFGFIRPDVGTGDVFFSDKRWPKAASNLDIRPGHPCAYVPKDDAKGPSANRFVLLYI